jgi:hypothetical protein
LAAQRVKANTPFTVLSSQHSQCFFTPIDNGFHGATFTPIDSPGVCYVVKIASNAATAGTAAGANEASALLPAPLALGAADDAIEASALIPALLAPETADDASAATEAEEAPANKAEEVFNEVADMGRFCLSQFLPWMKWDSLQPLKKVLEYTDEASGVYDPIFNEACVEG